MNIFKMLNKADREEKLKIVARYMDMQYDPLRPRAWSEFSGWRHSKVHFDDDWNWLIPVYSKIMSEEFSTANTEEFDLQTEFEEAVWGNRIDHAFDCVVKYLKEIRPRHEIENSTNKLY